MKTRTKIKTVLYKGLPLIETEHSGKHSVRFAEPCPYCGKRHIHGRDAEGEEEPGHLVAHCLNARPDNPGYYIVAKGAVVEEGQK